jgi:hypothetical protein
LCNTFDYIALGSSGEYWKIGTIEWFNRMDEAMKVICNELGYPKVKVHMLRCLNPKIFTKYPFYSADSSNLAQNHHIKGGEIILKNIESFDFAKKYNFQKQLSLFNKE